MPELAISRAESRKRATLPRTFAHLWRVDILLVEDDRADASLILKALRRNGDVGKVFATDAPDAALFELASQRIRPSLILLDLHMPKVSGFKFLRALREIPSMRETPVVFLTTSRLARDVEEAQASSAHLFVVKPSTFEELQARIDSVVDQAITGSWSKMS